MAADVNYFLKVCGVNVALFVNDISSQIYYSVDIYLYLKSYFEVICIYNKCRIINYLAAQQALSSALLYVLTSFINTLCMRYHYYFLSLCNMTPVIFLIYMFKRYSKSIKYPKHVTFKINLIATKSCSVNKWENVSITHQDVFVRSVLQSIFYT